MGPEFVETLLARRDGLVPSSAEEIARVEKALGVAFPPSFRRFAERMGNGAQVFLTGTDVRLSGIAERTAEARAMLNEASLAFPDDAVVFVGHQGYDFTWLCAAQGDASPVYGYVEGASAIEERFPSFGLWLAWALQQP